MTNINYYICPSDWEPVPFLLRWRGKERRRVTYATYFLFVYHLGYKRVWEYRK